MGRGTRPERDSRQRGRLESAQTASKYLAPPTSSTNGQLLTGGSCVTAWLWGVGRRGIHCLSLVNLNSLVGLYVHYSRTNSTRSSSSPHQRTLTWVLLHITRRNLAVGVVRRTTSVVNSSNVQWDEGNAGVPKQLHFMRETLPSAHDFHTCLRLVDLHVEILNDLQYLKSILFAHPNMTDPGTDYRNSYENHLP